MHTARPTPRSVRPRPRHAWWAAALAGLLAACGGGQQETAEQAQVDETGFEQPSTQVLGRQFGLWPQGQAAAEQAARAEQLALDPAQGGSQARLIVRLNPAAVPPASRVAILSAGGSGESSNAEALRAQQLAAKAQAVAQAAQSVLARVVLQRAPGAQVQQQFSHALEAFVVTLPWADAQAVADALAQDPAVDGVELDRRLQLEQTAGTPRALNAAAWGVDRIDQRQRSFDRTFSSPLTGSGVSVYIVDTGITPHNQFGTRLRPGFSAINDGRGTRDCHGHGTHVGGSAAGATVGVAPGAQLVPVRVMDCAGGGSSSSLLAGLDWIAAQGSRPGVVNLSLGGPASGAVDAAAQRLLSAGFSVVAAAGNSRADACTLSPARAQGVLTVAATDGNDMMASYSNWGGCVALWAPGSQIGSAGIASADAVVGMSGTSMAAPHAAGAAALLLQAQPAATPPQLLERLRQSATPDLVQGSPAGTTRSLLYAGSDGSLGTAAPLPALPSVRVQSLTMTSKVPTPGSWTAHSLVRVVNQAGQPVGSARVLGRFSHMSSDIACTTASNGECTLNSSAAPWGAMPLIGFALSSVTAPRMGVDTSGPARAQLAQPPAPVATLSALTGTMLRASARSTEWTPRFTATLRAQGGATVAQARVLAVLTVYGGGRPLAQQAVVCTTASNGQCALNWSGPKLSAAYSGATLQVLGVSRPFLSYQPGALTQATVGQVP